MRERIDRLSEEQQFRRSRLPSFTAEEIDLIKGSSDFLGINHYTSFICTPRDDDVDVVFPTTTDVDASCYQLEEWPVGASRWLRVVPWGLRNILNWIKEEYDNPEVMITENGFSDESRDLRDCERVEYYNVSLIRFRFSCLPRSSDKFLGVPGFLAPFFLFLHSFPLPF